MFLTLFSPFTTHFVCLFVDWFTLVALIANNLDSDQTAPLPFITKLLSASSSTDVLLLPILQTI